MVGLTMLLLTLLFGGAWLYRRAIFSYVFQHAKVNAEGLLKNLPPEVAAARGAWNLAKGLSSIFSLPAQWKTRKVLDRDLKDLRDEVEELGEQLGPPPGGAAGERPALRGHRLPPDSDRVVDMEETSPGFWEEAGGRRGGAAPGPVVRAPWESGSGQSGQQREAGAVGGEQEPPPLPEGCMLVEEGEGYREFIAPDGTLYRDERTPEGWVRAVSMPMPPSAAGARGDTGDNSGGLPAGAARATPEKGAGIGTSGPPGGSPVRARSFQPAEQLTEENRVSGAMNAGGLPRRVAFRNAEERPHGESSSSGEVSGGAAEPASGGSADKPSGTAGTPGAVHRAALHPRTLDMVRSSSGAWEYAGGRGPSPDRGGEPTVYMAGLEAGGTEAGAFYGRPEPVAREEIHQMRTSFPVAGARGGGGGGAGMGAVPASAAVAEPMVGLKAGESARAGGTSSVDGARASAPVPPGRPGAAEPMVGLKGGGGED